MGVCGNCGKEYEGRFCPECGMSNSGVCGNCGSAVGPDAKFCNECGSRLGEEKSEVNGGVQNKTAGTGDGPVKAIRIARLAPAIMFIVFSFALFLFYLAPVVTVFGEGVGNVYTLISDLPEQAWIMILLLLLGSCSFAASVVFAVLYFFYPGISKRKKQISSLVFERYELFDAVSCAVYLLFFVISCVIIGVLNANELTVGACPILMLVFSLLFLIAGAAAVVLRRLLPAKNKKIGEKVAAADAKVREKRLEKLASSFPDGTFPPEKKRDPSEAGDEYFYNRYKSYFRRSLYAFLALTVVPICIFPLWFLFLLIEPKTSADRIKRVNGFFIATMSVLGAMFVALVVLDFFMASATLSFTITVAILLIVAVAVFRKIRNNRQDPIREAFFNADTSGDVKTFEELTADYKKARSEYKQYKKDLASYKKRLRPLADLVV